MARMVARIELHQQSVPEAGKGISLVRTIFTHPAFTLEEAAAQRGYTLTIPFDPDLLTPVPAEDDGDRRTLRGIAILRLRHWLPKKTAPLNAVVGNIVILDDRDGDRMLSDFAEMRAAGIAGTNPSDLPGDPLD